MGEQSGKVHMFWEDVATKQVTSTGKVVIMHYIKLIQ